jgi:hypothetical protein
MAGKTDMEEGALSIFEEISNVNGKIERGILRLDDIVYGYDLVLFFLDDDDKRYKLQINSVSYFSYQEHSFRLKNIATESDFNPAFATISKTSELIQRIRLDSLEVSDYFNISHVRLNCFDVLMDILILGEPNIHMNTV